MLSFISLNKQLSCYSMTHFHINRIKATKWKTLINCAVTKALFTVHFFLTDVTLILMSTGIFWNNGGSINCNGRSRSDGVRSTAGSWCHFDGLERREIYDGGRRRRYNE